MQDRFKFRVWDKENKCLHYPTRYSNFTIVNGTVIKIESYPITNSAYLGKRIAWEFDYAVIMQCTGLKDKNGLNLLFECDIINTEGIKIGNCYENEHLLKDTTNFVIKGMGTKEWRNSEQEAIKRGCYYAE